MKRLPGSDYKTRRFEVATFFSLGLAALAAIGFALIDGVNFASERESIAAVLSGGSPASDDAEMAAKTNIAVASPVGTQTKPAGAPGPQS